jgi:hypothetical protein
MHIHVWEASSNAKFLTPQERQWAVERLRNNNAGVETKEIKWKQVLETLCLLLSGSILSLRSVSSKFLGTYPRLR